MELIINRFVSIYCIILIRRMRLFTSTFMRLSVDVLLFLLQILSQLVVSINVSEATRLKASERLTLQIVEEEKLGIQLECDEQRARPTGVMSPTYVPSFPAEQRNNYSGCSTLEKEISIALLS